MKAGSLALAAIVSLAAAQPHKNQHKHKRDIVTEVSYVTATAPNVVVYVDGNGVPVSTSYAAAPAAAVETAAPAAAAPAEKVAAPAKEAAVPAKEAAAPVKESAAPVVKEAQASAVEAADKKTSSTPVAATGGDGICYSPYNADNSCKSASQVAQDLAQLRSYSIIRLYGVDCNQVGNVLAGKGSNQKIFAGIYDINEVESETATLISAVDGKWENIDTVSVGNELLNQGSATASQLVTAINAAKGQLKPAGYTGPVVYVDTFNAMIAQNKIDQSLCQASDYSAANAHAFFSSITPAADAGEWVKNTAQQIQESCPSKKVVITESGWPSAGSSNGAAIPSEANQQTAISTIKSAFPDGGVFLFSAYNDLWKVNAAWNFFAEQSYGIYGNAPSS